MTDEKLLLSGAATDSRKLEVVNAGEESRCVYSSPLFRMSQASTQRDAGREYRRNLNFDELQIQVRGTRTLVSEVGCVDLVPGDFVRIPAGIAHASIGGASLSLQVQSAKPLRRRADPAKFGEPRSLEQVEALRKA
jgi:mannose-6-phosphate isomerase class I